MPAGISTLAPMPPARGQNGVSFRVYEWRKSEVYVVFSRKLSQ